jgi:hypothetical protein
VDESHAAAVAPVAAVAAVNAAAVQTHGVDHAVDRAAGLAEFAALPVG